ncbi:MAG: aldose 1-epimerase [Vicinamibacterales bacterium]
MPVPLARRRVVTAVLAGLAALALAAPAAAQRYTAARDGETVVLSDRQTDTVVTVVPSVGNIAIGMRVKGHDVLRYQRASLAEFRAQPGQTGIPFMGPWIGRLDEQAFYANGRRHPFDMTLGNVRGEVPIHGFLTATDRWRVTAVAAGGDAAWVTSRLEVYRHPEWMRQWPYAHVVEITYRLAGGVLEVATAVENLSAEPMPLSIGYHPYFQLTDSPRDEWQVAVGARTRWQLDGRKLPTGQTEPTSVLLPGPRDTLRDYSLDEVFSDLVRDADGRSTTTVWGKQQRLDVVLGPRYRSVVVWAPNPTGKGKGGQGDSPPAERNFICIEPMVGIGNALNLAHKGVYKELQTVAPGETWRESFWIRPTGF